MYCRLTKCSKNYNTTNLDYLFFIVQKIDGIILSTLSFLLSFKEILRSCVLESKVLRSLDFVQLYKEGSSLYSTLKFFILNIVVVFSSL